MHLVIRYKGEEQSLRVDDKDIIVFPSGLVGFPDWHRFVLLEDPELAPICILQNLDDTDIALLVTDPWYVAANYEIDLQPEDMVELGLSKAEDGRVLCILATKEEGPARVTANLLGPVVINHETRLARQVVLPHSRFSAQHPVLLAESAEANAK